MMPSLRLLGKGGIAVNDRTTEITMAHSVCAGLDNNAKTSFLAMRLMKDTDLSLRQSSYFIGVSMSAYCPQYVGATDDSVNWLYPFPPLM